MVKEDSSESADEGVIKRLDAIIRLLMDEQHNSGKITRNEQILALDSIGLSSGDIGQIIGWPSGDVSSKLSKLRKVKKK